MSFSNGSPGEAGQTIPGVVAGIVTDNRDPQGMGRVKLRFPWRTANDESDWARIAVPMAGPDRGTFFLPEVGDEVLVAFEDGDIHHPYVVGALWNGEDTPPADNADGNNDVRTIRSRRGHEVVLDDGEDGGRLELATAGGRTIVLDDSSGGEKITVDDGKSTIELDGTSGTVSVSGGTKVAIEATTLELSGTSISIDADGPLSLQGSIVNIN